LKTLSAYPTLQRQTLRLKECGFISGQEAIDINLAHDRWMGKDELTRISKLELLDEMEEWRLLASHYCLAWAWKAVDNANESHSGAFDEWNSIKNS
jgi:[phosphatase 2A protein]-leucine-carboxy methyltransferase